MTWCLLLICAQRFILPGPAEIPQPNRMRPTQTKVLAWQGNEALGVGILRPADTSALRKGLRAPQRGAGWLMDVRMPVYAAPGKAPWGWIYDGWLIPEIGPKKALHQLPFEVVVLDPALDGLPVWEMCGDWLRFGNFGPGSNPDGSFWVHREMLGGAGPDLEYEGWGAFLERHPGPLSPLTPLALYTRPDGETVVAELSLQDNLRVFSRAGDWMKVGVVIEGANHVGWVRWNGSNGPQLYFPTKGL